MSKKILVPLVAAFLLSSCGGHPEDSAKRFLERGDEQVARGRYNSAVIEYRNAIKELPKSPTAHTKLGHVYVAMAKTQEAYREFSIAAGLDPADAESRIEAGRLLLDAQMNEEAQIRADQEGVGTRETAVVQTHGTGRGSGDPLSEALRQGRWILCVRRAAHRDEQADKEKSLHLIKLEP